MTLRTRLWRVVWRVVLRAWYGRMVRLPVLLAVHRVGRTCSGEESPLAPLRRDLDFDPEHITHAGIRRLLQGEKLTAHGMDVAAVNCLCKLLETNRVRTILEFGSGISTLVLAGLGNGTSKDRDNSGLPNVVSVDESEEYANHTQNLLKRRGLESVAAVIHCPLAVRVEFGQTVTCYSFDPDAIAARFAGWQPEAVLVDGPSTGGLARAVAVKDALASFPGIRVVLMDDALRVHELECMQRLERAGLLRFRGVILQGKGLAVGLPA